MIKETFFLILFNISGEPTILPDGWSPIIIKEENCNDRKEFARNYIETIESLPPLFGIFCGSFSEIQEKIGNSK